MHALQGKRLRWSPALMRWSKPTNAAQRLAGTVLAGTAAQRRRKRTFARPALLPPPQADRRGPSQSANLGPYRCVCEDPWPRLQGSCGHGTATNRSPRCQPLSVHRWRSAVFALAANHRLAAVAAHGPALSSAITTPDERMQQKKYKDKGRLDGCNILEAANVVALASRGRGRASSIPLDRTDLRIVVLT
jgi:hypothetical protein